MTAAQRSQLLGLHRDMRLVSEQGLEQTSRMRKLFEQTGVAYDADVQNAQEFALLLGHDMTLLVDGLVEQNTPLGKSLYARLIVLTVYESTLSLRSLLAAKFRAQMVAALDLNDDADVRSVHSQACDLFEKCRSGFGDVRNGMIGHWDKDPQKRLDLISKAQERKVFDLAIQMSKMTRDLGRLFLPYAQRQVDRLDGVYRAQSGETA